MGLTVESRKILGRVSRRKERKRKEKKRKEGVLQFGVCKAAKIPEVDACAKGHDSSSEMRRKDLSADKTDHCA